MIYKSKYAQANLAESSEGQELDDKNLEIVGDECERLIKFPDKKLAKQIIIAPVGLVASGKSTVIKELQKDFPLASVSTDKIREVLKNKGFNNIRTQEIAYHLSAKLVAKGYSLVVDADCAPPYVQALLKEMRRKYDISVLYIHIIASEAEILKRLDANNQQRDYKGEKAIEVYNRRKQEFHSNLSINFFAEIETDSSDSHPQLSELKTKLKDFINN